MKVFLSVIIGVFVTLVVADIAIDLRQRPKFSVEASQPRPSIDALGDSTKVESP